MIRLLCALLCSLLPWPAFATPVEAILSKNEILMDAKFSGTDIFFVNARNDSGDIVVVVRGPKKKYVIHKKEEIGFVWVNRDRMKLFDVPSYYNIASTRPLTDIEEKQLFLRLAIGHDTLLGMRSSTENPDETDEFLNAFLEYQYTQKLFQPTVATLEGSERLLKTSLWFPDTIPTGDYVAEVYLLSDGEIIGTQSIPITVDKTGLEALIYNTAHDYPGLYGIIAICMAGFMGWFGSRVFNKGA